jgi:hypothetical protein
MKSKKLEWFLTILRVAGASFPGASSLVQLQAEFDSKVLIERITKLEDPISTLHGDVPELSRQIYRKLKLHNSTVLEFEPPFYEKFSRSLAAIESKGYLKNHYTLGNSYQVSISLIDPYYIMYLCSLEEDSDKMEILLEIVDNCNVGQWLDGSNLEIDLPLPVIKAVFDIYESNGYGLCSKEVGVCRYMAKA